MQTLRQDAQAIIDKALADALPDSAVRRALEQFPEAGGPARPDRCRQGRLADDQGRL